MPKTYSQLYYHFVWTTKGREPSVTPELEARLKNFVFHKCEELGCFLHAFGAPDDHAHTLVGMPPSLSPATFAQRIKGSSSHVLKERDSTLYLYWQEGYGVLTISKRDLNRVKAYVENQRERHRLGKVWPTFEKTEEEEEEARD